MKNKVIVDTNIVISALLGGKSRFILFDSRFEFIASNFILREVRKYIPLISKMSGATTDEIEEAISLLPLLIIDEDDYQDYAFQAKELIGDIDKNDVEILALYLAKGDFLWSEDKHFEAVDYKLNILKTKDFLNFI
ncbi:MAG: PIN domain-containing protein [Patescibacteria group bacterium]